MRGRRGNVRYGDGRTSVHRIRIDVCLGVPIARRCSCLSHLKSTIPHQRTSGQIHHTASVTRENPRPGLVRSAGQQIEQLLKRARSSQDQGLPPTARRHGSHRGLVLRSTYTREIWLQGLMLSVTSVPASVASTAEHNRNKLDPGMSGHENGPWWPAR